MIPFPGDAISGLSKLAGKFIEDKDKANEFAAEAAKQMLDLDSKLVSYQRDIIVAEAKSESFIARNWRPIMMLAFVGIIVNNYMLLPYLIVFGVPAVPMEVPEDMWTLLHIGVGGYVVGRSAEKTMKHYKD